MSEQFIVGVINQFDKTEALAAFNVIQENDRAENGTVNTGTIEMADGIQFIDQTYTDVPSANEWIKANAQTGGPALAVHFQGVINREGYPSVTINTWFYGAWCAA